MKKTDLIVAMLERSHYIKSGSLLYKVKKDGVLLYSSEGEAFHAPHLAAMFHHLNLLSICFYNEMDKRVEMMVFADLLE